MVADEIIALETADRAALLLRLQGDLVGLGFSDVDAKSLCAEIDSSDLIRASRGVVGYRLSSNAPPGTMGMVIQVPVFGTVFVFNAKKAAMALFLTGAAGVLVGPVGQIVAALKLLVGTDIAFVDYQSGLACNLVTLLDANTALPAQYLCELTSGKECFRPKAACDRRFEGKCVISVAQVQENLVRLEEKRAVSADGTNSYSANRL